MSEILRDYDPPKRGRKAKYPWAEWLDGRKRRLVQGKDFNASIPSMTLHIRRKVRSLNYTVTIHREPNALVVQVTKPETRKRV